MGSLRRAWLPALCMVSLTSLAWAGSGQSFRTQANVMVELTFTSQRPHANPFTDVTLDAVFTDPHGLTKKVPGFWAGDKTWKVRYVSPVTGTHRYRSICGDPSDKGLDSVSGAVEIEPYAGSNPLYRHGQLRIAADHRHFEHADGTPFFWLADTWWKCLSKRLSWDGFKELTADRAAKGFSAVQLVCGVYPDELPFQSLWANEGGLPYTSRDFSVVNPDYFDYADRRIAHLVESGIVPVIVGGWGRGDCDAMSLVGLEGLERHWRYLIARYWAFPTVWIAGGEAGGPQWTKIALMIRATDPCDRPISIHPQQSGRLSVTDERAVNFDMLQTGHGDMGAAKAAIPQIQAAVARQPAMPALIGEFCYEGHMQSAFQDVERYVFWASMLSGAAGLTYGAAGVWHASVPGDPGLQNAPGVHRIYDLTTWKEGMAYPGSTQIGIGKRLRAASRVGRSGLLRSGNPGRGSRHLPAEARCVQLGRHRGQGYRARRALPRLLFRSRPGDPDRRGRLYACRPGSHTDIPALCRHAFRGSIRNVEQLRLAGRRHAHPPRRRSTGRPEGHAHDPAQGRRCRRNCQCGGQERCRGWDGASLSR